MMKLLRSQSQAVLIIILIVIGGSFLFYGNVGNLLTGGGGGHGTSDFGRIDGENLSVAELYSAVRETRDSIMSGQADKLQQPGGREQVAQEAWRQLLMLHEADRLHIEVSDQELADYIRSQPLFQKNGVYDPALYQSQLAKLDSAFQISGDMFLTVLRNGLRTDAVSRALFSTVRTSVKDVSEQYEKYYGPAQVSVVTFDPKNFIHSVQVTPEEIAAEYKAHPDNPDYRTQEKRKIDYVLLSLTPEQAKLPAKEKAAAIEALGEKALNFALVFQPNPSADASVNTTPAVPPDFKAEAAKMGLTAVTSDFFTVDTPPTGLPPSPSLNLAAFALTKQEPVSKVVELDNGVAVLHLDDIQPSDLRPLDQVKTVIEAQLRQTKAATAAQTAAASAAQTLQADIAKGQTFKAAAASLKLPVQTLPPFIPAKTPQTDERLQMIAFTTTELAVGAVSSPIPIQSNNTTVVVHLDSRAAADPAGLAQFETRFRQSRDEEVRNMVYLDWANWEDAQKDTHKPPDLDQYGGVE